MTKTEKELARKEIDEAMARFLAQGGKIKEIEPGKSSMKDDSAIIKRLLRPDEVNTNDL